MKLKQVLSIFLLLFIPLLGGLSAEVKVAKLLLSNKKNSLNLSRKDLDSAFDKFNLIMSNQPANEKAGLKSKNEFYASLQSKSSGYFAVSFGLLIANFENFQVERETKDAQTIFPTLMEVSADMYLNPVALILMGIHWNQMSKELNANLKSCVYIESGMQILSLYKKKLSSKRFEALKEFAYSSLFHAKSIKNDCLSDLTDSERHLAEESISTNVNQASLNF